MASPPPVPFPRRLGFATGSLIFEDVPPSARIGLWHVLSAFANKGYIEGRWDGLQQELERIARVRERGSEDLQELLLSLPWLSVFVLIERVVGLLTDAIVVEDGRELAVPLDHVRELYHQEVNQLLAEEGIGYELRDRLLVRPGRANTQRANARVAHVLADPQLARAATHYRKALKFFTSGPAADHENAAKEAVAALEAAAKALLPGPKNALLPDLLRLHQGTSWDKIPPTLVKAMSAVFAFRGAADGVAHGGADGGVATPVVAEWVLSQVAAHITYLSDFKSSLEADVPF